MQSSTLSTYIGYITGPRAEQPVGVRVVEPTAGSRQYQRGSLYSVVEVVGDHPDRGAILERLLSELHRVYYSAKGSQSQVMVEAVQQTQQLLREISAHTPQYQMQLGVTCAALLGGRLLVASSGPAFALVRVSDRVHMFPSEPSLNAPTYGNIPIEVYRQEVQADDALFLGGGSWLRRVPTRTLASIVAFTNADNCSDAADELFDQAGQMPVPGLLIVLGGGGNHEPPRSSGYGGYGGGGGGYPGAQGGGSGSSGGTPRSSAPRRPRFGGLPTTLGSAPPAQLPPSAPTLSFQPSSDILPPSTSSPPTAGSAAQVGSQPRSSPREWDQPTELLPSRVTPVESVSHQPEPHQPAPPPDRRAALDESPTETQSPSAHSLEPPAIETTRHDHQVDSSRVDFVRSGDETAEEEQSLEPSASEPQATGTGQDAPTIPYPISPLEDESFGGDLPVEPGDDYDPIFPPSHEQIERPPRQPSWLEQWQAQAGQRMGQARTFLGRMLPERREPEDGTEWEEISDELIPPPKPARPRYNELEAQMSAAALPATQRNAVASSVAADDDHDYDDGAAAGVAPVMEMSPFAPPTPTQGARARVFLLIALIIVILVPITVMAITWGKASSRDAEAERLTARAELALIGAQTALDEEDKATAGERLTEAQDFLAQAIALNGSNDQREALIDAIELELQEVFQVTKFYALTDPLITFPPDARPQNVLVVNEDIFVIDAGRQALLQYRFDPATRTVSDQLGQVLLTQGDVIDGATVGTLTDLAWLPLIPGFEDRPGLLITDRNNNVFRYDQRVEGATLMPFGDRAAWGSIGQVQTYNGRIYVADEAQGSILRYDPGQFNAPGEPWFEPGIPVNLAGLVSMEIDGDIWLLLSNGTILRFRDRVQLPFSPDSSIDLAKEPVDMFVTGDQGANIYVVDASEDRILVYDKSGAYVGQLRAPEENLLRGLSSLYIDDVAGVMYILTQTGLFAHPVIP